MERFMDVNQFMERDVKVKQTNLCKINKIEKLLQFKLFLQTITQTVSTIACMFHLYYFTLCWLLVQHLICWK